MAKTKTEPNNEGEVIGVHPKEVNIRWPKVFLGITLVATIAGALFATKTLQRVEKNIAEAKEAARPAAVSLTKITTADCKDCFNIDNATAVFKKQNVKIQEEQTFTDNSTQAQSLIKTLGITRVPTYIVTGDVKKKSLEAFVKANGKIKNNTFVFTKVQPVFIDPTTKKFMGRVTITYLTDATCAQCQDIKQLGEQYKKSGVVVAAENEIAWNTEEGQRLIGQYKITKLPTFLLSSDIDVYDEVKASWSRIGTVEQDKTYIARNLFLPYRDVEKGQIVGLVDIIYLTDSSCSDCYKPEELQKQILVQGFGVGFSSERTVDINSEEGQSLKDKYNITKLPTVILSKDADQYANLKNVWKSVGTVESDDRYVFREMARMGNVIYKDLATDQVIRPTQPTGAAQK